MQDWESKTVEELEQLLPAEPVTEQDIDLFNRLAAKLLHVNRERALDLASRARQAANARNYIYGDIKARSTLGWLQADPQEGIALLVDCLPQLAALNKLADQLPVLKNLALLSRKAGDLDAALTYAQQAVTLCETQGLTDKLGNSLSLLATIYITRCDYALALQLMLKALELLEQYGQKAEIASACSNLTALYFNLENLDKALEYAQKTSLNYKEANQTMLYAEALLIEGQCQGRMNKPAEALQCFEAALLIAQQIHHTELEAEIVVNMGGLYLLKNEYEQAGFYLSKGLELCSALKLLQPQVYALMSLGTLFKSTGYVQYNLQQAEEYLLEALAVAEPNGLKWDTREIAGALADLYAATGNWQAAYNNQKRFTILEKEINTSESRNQLANFEIEKELALSVKEKEVTDRILHNILPKKIATRLRTGDEEIIERYESATVLFADIVGFTTWSKDMPIAQLAKSLNKIFSLFDELAHHYKVEKIKTIGDSYMCVAGLPERCEDHAERIAHMACAMIHRIHELFPDGEIQLRIGIQTGEVIAGVLGKNKYAYDLWEDTVNTASRMESHSLPGRIQVTEEVKKLLNGKFTFHQRKEMEVKGKGTMQVFFMEPLSSYSS